MKLRLVPIAWLVSSTAFAQQPTVPDPVAPLAQIKDDKQLAEALSSIVNDPSVPNHDKAARDKAQGLMSQGVKLLLASSYDQALANLLEAYATFPHPMILINIAS